jgi:hypothetical protein
LSALLSRWLACRDNDNSVQVGRRERLHCPGRSLLAKPPDLPLSLLRILPANLDDQAWFSANLGGDAVCFT